MEKKYKNGLLSLVVLAGGLFGTPATFADDMGIDGLASCIYPRLVLNLDPFSNIFGATNDSICVDVPVALDGAKVVFNLDTHAVDGKGQSKGLKHMVMFATAMKARINAGLVRADEVAIIGVLHGAASKWALKESSGGDTSQQKWIKSIFKLRQQGINIQLEICGVNMMSNHWTKADLFSYDDLGEPDTAVGGRIYVNGGAIGRMIDLQQNKFVYLHEAYE